MPGFVLHLGATVQCAHAGQAQPTVTSPRVTVGGQPLVTMTPPYVVSGCPLVPQAGGPCVSAQWVVAATRVTVRGVPGGGRASPCGGPPPGPPRTGVVSPSRVMGL